MTDKSDTEIFRSDYCVVQKHSEETVAIFVGNPPERSTPEIIDARALRDALATHLHGEKQ